MEAVIPIALVEFYIFKRKIICDSTQCLSKD